jgi:hypothetical protein
MTRSRRLYALLHSQENSDDTVHGLYVIVRPHPRAQGSHSTSEAEAEVVESPTGVVLNRLIKPRSRAC